MKQEKLKFLVLLVMVWCSISASAYDFMVDSIAYDIVNETEVAVTSENSSSPRYSQLSVAVIPETVTNQGITYTVTSIANNAFNGTTTLRSITIPATITAMGDSAFYKCSTLAEVHISSIESWCNMNLTGYYSTPTYYARNLFLNDEEITELVVPDGVTEIKDFVFFNCDGFTTATMPNSVLTIGKCAFANCSNMTSVAIGESITSIGSAAFEDCRSLVTARVPDSVVNLGGSVFSRCDGLTSVIIGNSVKRLESFLFYSCDRLQTVTIGNSVTDIVGNSFSYCTGLLSLTIPRSVAKIDELAFDDCYRLTSINVVSDNPYFDSRDNCNAIIQTSTNTLVKGCKTTVIPNTVEVIGDAAFKEINVDSMPIPNSVKKIGWIAFWLCRSLKKIHLPNSVTFIEHDAFNGCSAVTSMTVDSDNPVYDSRDSCNAIIETATDQLLYGCKNTVIPKSVKIIGSEAFEDCYELKSIALGDSATLIGHSAFYDCRSLAKATFGKSLKTIAAYAFYLCESLESVTLPATVTSIGENAFHYCRKLKSLISYAVTPPTMTNANTFSDYNTPVLYVPEEALEAYKSTECWSRFATILPINKGDVNGDSRLSISDMTALVDVLLTEDTSAVNIANSDLNADGKVDIADVTALIDMLLAN